MEVYIPLQLSKSFWKNALCKKLLETPTPDRRKAHSDARPPVQAGRQANSGAAKMVGYYHNKLPFDVTKNDFNILARYSFLYKTLLSLFAALYSGYLYCTCLSSVMHGATMTCHPFAVPKERASISQRLCTRKPRKLHLLKTATSNMGQAECWWVASKKA